MNHLNTITILGYPRSGTTWFANLLNSHPDVVYRHEVIGRCHKDIPAELFEKLKFNHSLTDHEYEDLMPVILAPNVESDRAPFFSKNHLLISNPTFHYFSWLICKTAPFLRPLYRFLFFPKGSSLTLVIKETRSTINMDSILKGLRSDTNIVLFRHPCGAVGSSLSGIATGKMQPSSKADRSLWFNLNKENEYVAHVLPTADALLALPEHEYLALLWRTQNEDYLAFSTRNNIYINYENFMMDQEARIKELFQRLSMRYDPGVRDFVFASSGAGNTRPRLKDSSSNFYSVYRTNGFNPYQWKESLDAKQISDIEKHTLDIFHKLLEHSNH